MRVLWVEEGGIGIWDGAQGTKWKNEHKRTNERSVDLSLLPMAFCIAVGGGGFMIIRQQTGHRAVRWCVGVCVCVESEATSTVCPWPDTAAYLGLLYLSTTTQRLGGIWADFR